MDLKQFLNLDQAQIESSLTKENGLKKLPVKNNDIGTKNLVDRWYNTFKYDNKKSVLENFLLYRAASAFNLYTNIDDADITQPALDFLKAKLLGIQGVKHVHVGKEIDKREKRRTFKVELVDGTVVLLESDTAHSLMGDLGLFMRKIIPKLENLSQGSYWPQETYMKLYSLETNKSNSYYQPYKLFYFYSIIKEIEKSFRAGSDEYECFESLERRAGLVHTLNNMMLVPYGYNSKRGFGLKTYKTNRKINDRLDLTYLDWDEMIADPNFSTELLQQRLNNDKCTLESIRFLVENKEILLPNCYHYHKDAEKKNLSGITMRSHAIANTLS